VENNNSLINSLVKALGESINSLTLFNILKVGIIPKVLNKAPLFEYLQERE
jgi:hypothetical protein